MTRQLTDYEEFKQLLEKEGGFIRACWCGTSDCEDAIKSETGATIRTIPLTEEKVFGGCIRCGKTAEKVAYFARSY